MFTYIIGGLIGAAFIFAGYRLYVNSKNNGCGGCSGCSNSGCPSKK